MAARKTAAQQSESQPEPRGNDEQIYLIQRRSTGELGRVDKATFDRLMGAGNPTRLLDDATALHAVQAEDAEYDTLAPEEYQLPRATPEPDEPKRSTRRR